ncbi:MAG: ABC transporter permease [Pelagibacteraceae bacterium]|jgi:ABC-2 type transport system permease protein|nr:ABC transporter permease [Pelagibacteraceae bacterium]|tara:strand:- start:375 stop:1142 length:768 start_codon:yes stop_codon:yes gene_type:complete
MKFNYQAFKAIYLHEMDRFKRTLGQSLLSPVLSTSLYFIVFGSVIGGYVENIDGISYGSYIVPGLLMLTLLTQSISNTSFGIFFPKFNGTIYEILAAPISTFEIVLAFVGAGATKTLIVGIVIFITSTFFVDVYVQKPFLMIMLLILVAFTFALFGFLIGLMSSNFEQMSVVPTLVITPMVFLGGSLYSLDMLPPFWQTVTYFNPVVYLINGLRYSFYGVSDFNIWLSISSMIIFFAACVITVSMLLKKGYNIKS